MPRLAPLYDLNSLHPCQAQRRKIRSSLKIGSHYKIHELQPDHLTRRIDGCRLTGRVMAQVLRELLETLPREAGLLAEQFRQSSIDSAIPEQIRDGIVTTVGRLNRALDRAE